MAAEVQQENGAKADDGCILIPFSVEVVALLVAVRKDLRRPAKRRGGGIIREPLVWPRLTCLQRRQTEVAARLCPPPAPGHRQKLLYSSLAGKNGIIV
jgi:hypothetical protein